ncbi:MAG: N-6 DNA methylase, partial [Candidatus Njordarchaeales archaeon]
MTPINLEALNKLEPWARKVYLLMIEEFGEREFDSKELKDFLKLHNTRMENAFKIISKLKKSGLLIVKKDPKDSRRSLYRLIIIDAMFGKKMPTKDDLIKLCKSAADLIRTAVDYKVILLFLFYKAISDKWHKIAEKYIREGFTKEQAYALANEEYLKLYDMTEEKVYSWHEITSKGNISNLANAIIKIARMNSNKIGELEELVGTLGLMGLLRNDTLHILKKLIELFNRVDFSITDYDLIGDGYQWILSYFAPMKAKEGETYTPTEIIQLLVRLLDIENESTVLDPACGSAAMLIESYNYVKSKIRENTDLELALKLVGQERNTTMATISKMNLILHGISTDYEIYIGDSLINPQFDIADYVIANPPWNQDGYGEQTLAQRQIRKIYLYGFPPRNSADWAWIQLMLYYSKKKVGIVLDQGALFRGGRERKIRIEILKADLLEAVILLPEKLFYNVTAPGIIMIFNKEKAEDRKGKIIFINASNEYKQHPEVRRLNKLVNIDKIVDSYKEFKDIDGFSKVVSLEEIR